MVIIVVRTGTVSITVSLTVESAVVGARVETTPAEMACMLRCVHVQVYHVFGEVVSAWGFEYDHLYIDLLYELPSKAFHWCGR